MFRRFIAIFSLFLILLLASPVKAQCAMCKMPAESNLANGGTDGAGLNKGIMYMFITPYILLGTVAFLWWRGRRRDDEDDETNTDTSIAE